MPLLRIALIAAAFAALAPAALLRVEIADRSPVLDGRAFGRTGPYERIVGKAHFAVDPALPANRIVRDLDKAPRAASGLVEFSADLYILRPRDPGRGNGALLLEISNRGNKRTLGFFNRASANPPDPRAPADFGDGFLLEQGYTLAWIGWQFDVPAGLRLYAPVIKGLKGLVRAEITTDRVETEQPLADRNHVAYPVVNPDDPALTLTVRDRVLGPRIAIPRSQWRIVDGARIAMPAGFQPGRIYELVYTSQDPAVVGLGPAAVRDLVSYLKYGADLAPVKRAYGFGISQSGRFLRTFLYFGFNQDEKGRKVFDGVLAHVAGAGRGSFNHRFAQPSRDGHPFYNTLYPTDIFPFTDLPETDGGVTGGILSRTPASATPKIFYTNSAYEYYGRAASLIHTTIDGARDAPLAPNTRIYFFAGGQHGPAAFPPQRAGTQNLANPNPYTWSMRALLLARDRWLRDGAAPPASQYPRISEGALVPLTAVRFPHIPGVAFPTRIQTAYHLDYGPRFVSDGIVTIEPPKVGAAFPMLVPQVDPDGNDASGIRMPSIAVPLATYTGWNLRAKELGAPDELFSMAGSYVPFARTKMERGADPRPSIQERYPTRDAYLDKVRATARDLAQRGYLLSSDVEPQVQRAAAEWDWIMRN
jgi:hypothetical protein